MYKHTNDHSRPTGGVLAAQLSPTEPGGTARPPSAGLEPREALHAAGCTRRPETGRWRCAPGGCTGALRPSGGGRRVPRAPPMPAETPAPSLATGTRVQRPAAAATALGTVGEAAAVGRHGSAATVIRPARAMQAESGESDMAQGRGWGGVVAAARA